MTASARTRRIVQRNRAELAVVVMRGSSLVLIALGAIAAARLLGTEEYGRYTTATAFITIAMAAISAGHIERAIRVGASPVARDRGDVTAVAIAVDVLRYAPLWVVVMLPIGLATQVSIGVIVFLGVPIAVLLGLAHVLEGYARGSFQELRDLLPILLVGPALVTLGCAAAIVVDLEVVAAELLSFRFLLVVLTVAYFGVRLGLHRPSVWRAPRPSGVENLRGFAAATILYAVQQQSSILVAGFIGSAAAGQYTAAFRSVEPIIAGMTAVMLLVGPSTAVAVQSGDLESLRDEVKQQARIGFGLAIVPAVVVFVWPGFVLGLFGDGFDEATAALRVLAVGALVVTFFGPSVLFANMVGLKRQVAMWMALALVVQLGGSGVLYAFDELTVTRVAVATVAGTVVWNLGLWRASRRHTNMTTAIV